jgi:8-oxo-dGTP diphosphatase
MSIIVTVDVVLLTLVNEKLQVALFAREKAPALGMLALPGGFIHEEEDESTEAAAVRVLMEKAGVRSPYLEQLQCFSGPKRDERGWSLTVAYFAVVPRDVLHERVKLFSVDKLPKVAFDHSKIVKAAVQRVRSKSGYSSLPVHLCGSEFTIPELHAVYEAVIGEQINLAGFRRKLQDLDVLEEVPGAMKRVGASRPAQVYRQKAKFAHALSVRDRGL